MRTARLTSRGRVTIPKELREKLRISSGDELEFTVDDSGQVTVSKRVASPFEKYRGYLHHLTGQSVDELVAEMRDPE